MKPEAGSECEPRNPRSKKNCGDCCPDNSRRAGTSVSASSYPAVCSVAPVGAGVGVSVRERPRDEAVAVVLVVEAP